MTAVKVQWNGCEKTAWLPWPHKANCSTCCHSSERRLQLPRQSEHTSPPPAYNTNSHVSVMFILFNGRLLVKCNIEVLKDWSKFWSKLMINFDGLCWPINSMPWSAVLFAFWTRLWTRLFPSWIIDLSDEEGRRTDAVEVLHIKLFHLHPLMQLKDVSSSTPRLKLVVEAQKRPSSAEKFCWLSRGQNYVQTCYLWRCFVIL